MNLREFETWLDAYGRAWEMRDPEAATDLVAEDTTYHETPFDEPCRGRGEILRYWSDVPRSQENVSFSYGILSTTDDTGIAHWRASFVRLPARERTKLDGVFLVKMGVDGRCTEFREWWHKQEERAS